MPNKKTKSVKRIPVGTRVKFQSYPGLPGQVTHEGVVLAQPGSVKAGRNVYLVQVDRTPTGKPKAKPAIMRPYASRLEAQNPKALK